MRVKCRKTGRIYDPNIEFNKLLKQTWVLSLLKRMKNK